MDTELNYNERSWAIDLISEINNITLRRNLKIKKAGGEYTVKTGGNPLFPDVLLFGDSSCQIILQGWELKLPNTPVTDQEFIDNAKKKSINLNLNSFLLWNASEAVLYSRENNNSFIPIKNWLTPQIKTKHDIKANSSSWKQTLTIILSDLDSFLVTNELKPTFASNALSSNICIEFLNRYIGIQSDYIKQESIKDSIFEAKINRWYSLKGKEFEALDKFSALASEQIILWLNRFFFTNYLKFFNENALLIHKLDHKKSIGDGLEIFKNISDRCGFSHLYHDSLGFKLITKDLWFALIELNQLLIQINFKNYEDSLEKIVTSTLDFSSKKTAGQFTTPIPLAEYLVSITMLNRDENVIDPCCGTGTIAKKAYDQKKTLGIPVEKAMDTIWASDLFSSPLQLSTIRLFEPRCIEKQMQIFQYDALKLLPEDKIEFFNSKENKIHKQLPKFHTIISNLPFVRFEKFGEFNDISSAKQSLGERLGEDAIDGKSDLYKILTLKLKDLIHNEGRLGFIISNSWLGTNAGKRFRDLILVDYEIKSVIISGCGRWFKPEVVTSILILEPRKQNNKDSQKDEISFITTLLSIDKWTENELKDIIQGTLLNESIEEKLQIQKYTIDEIYSLEKLGLNWNALFTNNNWLLKIQNKLDKVANHFEITRGHRRGWDKMFYPEEGHGIESEYLRPLIKSPKNHKPNSLSLEVKGEVFSCNESISNLEYHNKTGALNWIKKFEYANNTDGKPLKEKLKKPGLYWYQHDNEVLDKACLVIPISPNKKLNTFKVDSDCILNQRLTKLIKKCDKTNYEIFHALLNSSISMFFLESIGFGRGLGVLDTSASNIKKYACMLNPNLLNDEDQHKILEAFNPLTKRNPFDLPKELNSTDRINFDNTIIEVFNLDCKREEIYDSLLQLFIKRQTARIWC